MSRPDGSLVCDRCGLQGLAYGAPTRNYYLIDDLKVPLSRRIGVCMGCNTVGREIERLGSRGKAIDDWMQARRRLDRLQPGIPGIDLLLRLLFRHKIRRLERELLTQEARLNLFERRHDDACCLKCGSRDVAVLQEALPALAFTDDFLFYQGEETTSLFHPGCGGRFIYRGADFRLPYIYMERHFSPDGVLIHEQRI